jgi:hypothetical protein
VEQDEGEEQGPRKPRRRTFGDLADEFDAVALAARPRKKSTLVDYRAISRGTGGATRR